MTDYRVDLYAWSREQADAIARRSANELDWDNVAEEIRSLGGQQEGELNSRFTVLLVHLLKIQFQPEPRTRSWTNTVVEQRRRIARHLRRNPSLKSVQDEEFVDAYESARLDASSETDLPVETFPVEPPYTFAESLDPGWWPEPAQSSTVSNGS